MPLDQRVTFNAPLRVANRLRVPRPVRAQYTLEPSQILKITTTPVGTIGNTQTFLGNMRKDGYITIPPIVMALLKRDMPSIENQPIEVTIEPA